MVEGNGEESQGINDTGKDGNVNERSVNESGKGVNENGGDCEGGDDGKNSASGAGGETDEKTKNQLQKQSVDESGKGKKG